MRRANVTNALTAQIVDLSPPDALKWQFASPPPLRMDSVESPRNDLACRRSMRRARHPSSTRSTGRSISMAFLELVKGSAAGSRFELDGDRAIIGRSADCEVPIDVP